MVYAGSAFFKIGKKRKNIAQFLSIVFEAYFPGGEGFVYKKMPGAKGLLSKENKIVFFRNILINVRQNYIYINCNYMVNLNRIKVVLVEKDKTGKWLSEQLSKSTCDVSKWCKNTVQPDLNTLDKITKLLDVDVTYLLNATEKD